MVQVNIPKEYLLAVNTPTGETPESRIAYALRYKAGSRSTWNPKAKGTTACKKPTPGHRDIPALFSYTPFETSQPRPGQPKPSARPPHQESCNRAPNETRTEGPGEDLGWQEWRRHWKRFKDEQAEQRRKEFWACREEEHRHEVERKKNEEWEKVYAFYVSSDDKNENDGEDEEFVHEADPPRAQRSGAYPSSNHRHYQANGSNLSSRGTKRSSPPLGSATTPPPKARRITPTLKTGRGGKAHTELSTGELLMRAGGDEVIIGDYAAAPKGRKESSTTSLLPILVPTAAW
ncbi:hypothetical protein MMC25_000629 [Agyrium rufum]|nr:hypothetical protein [Agyrium rufum]